MQEAQELTEFMSTLDREVDVIWGVAFDDTLGNKVKITILAAGFDVTIRDEENELSSGHRNGIRISSPRQPKDVTDRLAEEYGKETVTRNNQAAARARYVILDPSQLDDDKVIEMFEKNPTFNRDAKFRNAIKEMSRASVATQPEATEKRASTDTTEIKFC